eukprot:Skav217189  [mRNA]  locus=scaffold557:47403:64110:+ [translate_table: standard]
MKACNERCQRVPPSLEEGLAWEIPSALPAAAKTPQVQKHMKRVACSDLSLVGFRDSFLKAQQPGVIEGHPAVAGWSTERWQDLRFWAGRHGHRTVPVEMGFHENDEQSAALQHSDSQGSMQLSEFTKSFLLPSNTVLKGPGNHQPSEAIDEWSASKVAYMAQHQLLLQIPELRSDILVPHYCSLGELQTVNVWIGTAGTVTALHYDLDDNFLVQVAGYKNLGTEGYLRLYSPEESERLYAKDAPRDRQKKHGASYSPVRVEHPDLQAHPDFANAPFVETILGPGEMLFIPRRLELKRVTKALSTLGRQSACAKCAAWSWALELLCRMSRHQLRPDVRSYGDEVLPDVVAYSAAISASALGAQWEDATALNADLRKRRLSADVICYNALIQACGEGQQWRRAILALAELQGAMQPSQISFNTAITACSRCGEWDMEERKLEKRLWEAMITCPQFQGSWRCGEDPEAEHNETTWSELKSRKDAPDAPPYGGPGGYDGGGGTPGYGNGGYYPPPAEAGYGYPPPGSYPAPGYPPAGYPPGYGGYPYDGKGGAPPQQPPGYGGGYDMYGAGYPPPSYGGSFGSFDGKGRDDRRDDRGESGKGRRERSRDFDRRDGRRDDREDDRRRDGGRREGKGGFEAYGRGIPLPEPVELQLKGLPMDASEPALRTLFHNKGLQFDSVHFTMSAIVKVSGQVLADQVIKTFHRCPIAGQPIECFRVEVAIAGPLCHATGPPGDRSPPPRDLPRRDRSRSPPRGRGNCSGWQAAMTNDG